VTCYPANYGGLNLYKVKRKKKKGILKIYRLTYPMTGGVDAPVRKKGRFAGVKREGGQYLASAPKNIARKALKCRERTYTTMCTGTRVNCRKETFLRGLEGKKKSQEKANKGRREYSCKRGRVEMPVRPEIEGRSWATPAERLDRKDS